MTSAGSINFNNSSLPIVFLQIGSNRRAFVKEAIRQAQYSNGKENVFFLTDTDFDQYPGINCVDISKYITSSNAFDAVYKHHSSNSYTFEKVCFNRWFIINEWVKQHSIPNFFYADCDVLIFTNLNTVHKQFLHNRYEGSVMFGNRNAHTITSPHSSFWSAKLVDEFCAYMYNQFANGQTFQNMINTSAQLAQITVDEVNVSDMLLADLFRLQCQRPLLNLFALEDEGICFDMNINVAYNDYKYTYILDGPHQVKKVFWCNKLPYGKVKNHNEPVQFYTLHFQGGLAKTLIPLYVNTTSVWQRLRNLYLSKKSTYKFKKRAGKAAKNT